MNNDGSLHAILGGSGGSRIFPSIAQVILNLECGYNISAAIERPRIHNQVVPEETQLEVGPEGKDEDLIRFMEARGHEMFLFDINAAVAESELRNGHSTEVVLMFRAVQGILVEDWTIWAASDSRKHGVAAAY